MMQVIIGVYAVVSVVTIIAYWRDKRAAQRDTWRVSERTLHLLSLGGGWPGAMLAQSLFRHKRRKRSFMVVFWLIVGAHAAAWSFWLWTR